MRILVGSLTVVVLAGLVIPVRAAEVKEVKPTKLWNGSVEDDKLMKDAPAVIVDKKTFEKIWVDWKIKGDVPTINFDKEIVVLMTSKGSRITMKCTLEDGNLKVGGIATADLGEGFRYILATVPREGVKKVNGKDLPK